MQGLAFPLPNAAQMTPTKSRECQSFKEVFLAKAPSNVWCRLATNSSSSTNILEIKVLSRHDCLHYSNSEQAHKANIARPHKNQSRSSLMESLADEELPARRSSSICSSLDFSNIRGQRRASNASLYSEKMEDDEWLDERCILGDGVVQNTYAAQRA